MKLPVLDIEGKEVRSVDVDESVFGITPNGAVLHQAYVRHRNNQRMGTANTKTRGEVQGSTKKVRMQKYTGRARAGSNRSPTRVGGGTVFGPRQRDYSQDMPKKMRRLAIRSALSGKVADGQLVVIDQLTFENPKTQEIIRILGNVGFDRSALVVTAEADRGVLASVRNLDRTKALPAAYLNVADMLNHAGLLMTEEAIRIAEGLWGAKKDGVKRPARPKARRVAAPAPAEEPAPKPSRRRAAAPVAEEEAEAALAEAVAEAAPEKPARAPRPRKAAAKTEAAEAVATEEAPAAKPKRAAAAPKTEAPVAKAKKPAAPKSTAKAEKPAAEAAKAAEDEKPKRATRATKSAKPEASAEEAPKVRRRTTKKTEESK
jgi:large subunit ribosomal protein L4